MGRRPVGRMRMAWFCATCAVALWWSAASHNAVAQESTPASTADAKTAASDQSSAGSKKAATSSPATTPSSSLPSSGSQAKSSAPATSHSAKSQQASVRRGKHGKRKTVARGQQKIDPERAQEIQQALIREHYLSGRAAGTWNQASEDAMRRYQADHGWQSKTVPDARALISLGLGPNHDHLLNPDSAMTSGPSTAKLSPAAASITPRPQSPAQAQPDSGPASQPGVSDPPRPQ